MIAAWLPTPAHYLLVSVIAVLIYVLTTRARHERRAPAAAIAWVLGLALIPYVMLPLYLLFGQRKVRPLLAPSARGTKECPHWAAELIESFGLAPPAICDIHLHADGAVAQAALFDTIDRARERLDVCTFLIGDDALGEAVIDRLVQKAQVGVVVRLLLDGFGAVTMPHRYMRKLRDAGVQVAVFRPFFGWRRMGPRNLRNHRKLTIADNQWLWSGGRNFAAEYFTGTSAQPAWLDLSFDLHGPVAAHAALQFDLDWASVFRQEVTRIPQAVAAAKGTLAQFLPSGPDQVEDTAQSLLIDACYRARRDIIAITPYFVPDDSLRVALRLAARRGVRITIAIPRISNHRLADFVRTRAMRDLAAAGVEFRLLPGMAHAKAVVIDSSLAMCGSINLDLRSLLLNHEAAVVFYGPEEIAWFTSWIEQVAAIGAPFRSQRPGILRDVAEGLLLTVAFQL